MAVFDPSLQPTQDPNYLNYSKPIGDIPADTATEKLLKGLGDLGTNVAATGEAYVKHQVDLGVDEAYKERDAFTASLNLVANGAMNKPQATADASTNSATSNGGPGWPSDSAGQPMNLMSGGAGGSDVPIAIKNGLNNISTLQGGIENGKISQTQYDGNVAVIAKNLRSQYPGYKDYIDEKISKVTGGDPANKYIAGIIEQLNTAITNNRSSREKIETQIRENARLPGQPQVYALYKSGQMDDTQVQAWLNKNLARSYELQQREAERNNFKGDQEASTSLYKDDATRMVGVSASANFEGMRLGTGLETPQGVMNFAQKVANGEIDISDQQAQTLAMQVHAAKIKWLGEINKQFDQMGDNGKTLRQGTGSAAAREIINNGAVLFDNAEDAFHNGKMGIAAYHMQAAEAAVNDAKFGLLTDKTVGEASAKVSALSNLLGPNFSAVFMSAGLMENMDAKLSNYVLEKKRNAVLQPDLRTTGVTTFRKDLEDAQSKHVDDPRTYEALLGMIKTVADPRTPKGTDPESFDKAKESLVSYFFDPDNRGVISKFGTDYIDPATGKSIPGKYAVFTRLTSPDTTSEIVRLGKKDPNIIGKYKNWAEVSFGRELFSQELQDFSKYQDNKNLKITWEGDNTKGHQLNVVPTGPQAKEIANATPEYLRQYFPSYAGIKESIDRINLGLGNLSNIEKATGGDVNAYLLKTLQNNGVDLTKGIQGVPEKIMQAIISSRPPSKMEDTFSRPRGSIPAPVADPFKTRTKSKDEDRVLPQ